MTHSTTPSNLLTPKKLQILKKKNYQKVLIRFALGHSSKISNVEEEKEDDKMTKSTLEQVRSRFSCYTVRTITQKYFFFAERERERVRWVLLISILHYNQ